MKDCEPEKGVVREGGFALGVSRGREEVRCDRREGEQAKGKFTITIYLHSWAHTLVSQYKTIPII